MRLLDQVTVFVSTVGDERNFSECMARLKDQTVRFRQTTIDHVAPLSSALQQMLDRCKTEYYIQVDEDMLLYPDAVERLYRRITSLDSSVSLCCGGLWDCDVEHPIYGVKIYRHRIVRQFPYKNTFSCEKTQLREITAAGYAADLLPLSSREDCFGEHGKHYMPRTIYSRWRRLLQKRRRYRHLPGRNLPWVDPWPKQLLERYRNTGDQLHLYALLGAIAGIVTPMPEDSEADFRDTQPDFDELAEYFEGGEDSIELKRRIG